MTPSQATVEVFWTAYQALPDEERSSLIEKIMKEDELFEDYLDNKSVQERRNEPSIPLEEYIAERAKKKAGELLGQSQKIIFEGIGPMQMAT